MQKEKEKKKKKVCLISCKAILELAKLKFVNELTK